MSKQKEGRTGTNSSVVVGGSKKRSKLHLKLSGLVLVCIFVAALVVAGTILFVSHHIKVNQNAALPPDTSHTPEAKATGLSLTGDYAGAQKLLDNQIAKTGDKIALGALYEQKATLAHDNNAYSDGLQFAQRAESLDPTANSANWIAQNAEQLGNKPLALEYYKKELQRVGKPVVQGDNDALIAKIKSLGG